LRLAAASWGGWRVVNATEETKKTTRDEEELCNDRDWLDMKRQLKERNRLRRRKLSWNGKRWPLLTKYVED
jgi:hypothetical protein